MDNNTYFTLWIALLFLSFVIGLAAGSSTQHTQSSEHWIRVGPTIAPCFASGDHWMAHWQKRDDGLCHGEDNPVQ